MPVRLKGRTQMIRYEMQTERPGLSLGVGSGVFESLRFHLLSFCCRSHAVSFVSPLTTVCERGGLFAVFRRSDAVVSFLRMRVAGPKASGQRVRTSENRAEAWAEGFRRRIAYFVELLLTLDGPNDSA